MVLRICQLCAAQDVQSGCTGAADTCVWHGCSTMRESRAGYYGRWRTTQIRPASCSYLLSAHSEERTLLLLRPHAFGERLRPTEAAITGLHKRIDAVGDQSER